MSNKSFACKHDGCTETFTNEDHCLVHQERHEMVLNVGLANKNQAFSDETPTPTRFIRNCEEVGLFQDLQNVNPFDETFKKAIDHSKNSQETLFVANDNLNTSDDTLHTPHIFPDREAALLKNSTSNDISNKSTDLDSDKSKNTDKSSICTDLDSDSPLDRSDALIIIDDSDEEVDQIIVDINQSNLRALPETEEVRGCVETSTSPNSKVSCNTNEVIIEKISLKDKLRERLQTRNGTIDYNISPTKDHCQDNLSNEKYLPQPAYVPESRKNNILTNIYNQSLVVQKPKRKRRCINPIVRVTTNESTVSSSTEITSTDGVEPDEDTLTVCNKDEDRKLRNRVAQSRSRMRKKIQSDVVNVQLKNLQTKTDDLRLDNRALKQQIHELKKYILSHHEKCAFTGDMFFLKKCLTEEVVPARRKQEVVPISEKKRKLLPVLPKNTAILQLQPSLNPIIVSVPPIKLADAKGNLNYIVITPPPI